MTIQDLFITPIYLILFGVLAYFLRPFFTDQQTRRYFLPALGVKFLGAIALGVIYQFYYGSGDTYIYFTYGSRWIWQAWIEDPILGLKILLENGGERQAETFSYTQQIWYYKDPHSFTIVRIAGLFDIFTFHTYSATALFFALFNFSGSWALFRAILSKYPYRIKHLALAIFFIPSIIFWGSGILKDTITFGALAWVSASAFRLIERREYMVHHFVILILGSWIIYSIKVYVLLTLIPMLLIWTFWRQLMSIRNTVLRWFVAPIVFSIYAALGILAISSVSQDSERYRLDRIAQSAALTAYDIRYGWGARTEGEGGYDLGTLDGTWNSMIRLFPEAVVVTLFRPFPWEVKNPLMLMSSIEGVFALFCVLYWIRKKGWRNFTSDPFMVFCFGFMIVFAFAVGISTFNFGSLARYKIPLLPFFYMFIFRVCDYVPSGQKGKQGLAEALD